MRKEVLLKEIKPHPRLKKLTAKFAGQKKILHDPRLLTPEAALLISKLLPIKVIEKDKSYLYISGHLTYGLIAQMFDPATTLEVEIIRSLSEKQINQYICGDSLLLPIVAGIAKPEIGERYDVVANNLDCNLEDLLFYRRQKDLCRALDCSRNTFFKHMNRQEKSNE